MKIKRGLIFICLFICLMSIASVSAADGDEMILANEGQSLDQDFSENLEAIDDFIVVEDDSIDDVPNDPEEVKTFEDLKREIDEVEDGGELSLTHNYIYESGSTEGIVINKSITINGNNHTIDGALKSRIFATHEGNITLNNLILVNGNSTQGGAILVNKALFCNGLVFQNNHADEGGALFVYIHSAFTEYIYINLTDCSFDQNYAKTGAAIKFELKEEPSPDEGDEDDEGDDPIDDGGDDPIDDGGDDPIDDGGDDPIDDGGDDPFDDEGISTYNIINCSFTNSNSYHGLIYANLIDPLTISNSTFENLTAQEGAAIYKTIGGEVRIYNSTFMNLHANTSGGAIATLSVNMIKIVDSKFINTTSINNGGAIACDAYADEMGEEGTIIIKNSEFKDSKSGFGGAIALAGGEVNITNCTFEDNFAQYSGGAIFTSRSKPMIENSTFINNKINSTKDKGAAITTFYRKLSIDNSKFINNSNNAIYCLDNEYSITNSLFENNGEAIYSTFAISSFLENNNLTTDKLSQNVTADDFYILIINSTGADINLVKNELNVDVIPAYFNLNDWGWVTPVKNQYESGACWIFATYASLESALLKSTGKEYEFSVNNLQKNLLLFSKYGHHDMCEGGWLNTSAEYLLSWYGAIPVEYEPFSVCGKISAPIITSDAIHIQDVIWVRGRHNLTDNDFIKEAILKYGALATDVSETLNGDVFNKDTSALYNHGDGSGGSNHAVAIVGWDDNFPASNFIVTPPGNGAWICKNSYGEEEYDNGFFYVSYYDTTIAFNMQIGFSFENTEKYNKNYQTDIGGTPDLLNGSGSYTYKNIYQSIEDDFISAVGTYFMENEDYTLEIFVNGVLKHTQKGVAPFLGFHTVKLTKNIPIKKGDSFEVVMMKSTLAYVNATVMHYAKGRSFVDDGNGFRDLALENATASLKVYTKPLADLTTQIKVGSVNTVYNGGKYLIVNVKDVFGDPLKGVELTIKLSNGVTKTFKTDAKGQVKFLTNGLAPKTYAVTITTLAFGKYLKTTQTAKIIVKKASPKITAKKKTFKRSKKVKKYTITLKDARKKAIRKAMLTLKIKGKTYKAKTNTKGKATFKIKKLTKRGTFKATITYKGNAYYKKVSKKVKIRIK